MKKILIVTESIDVNDSSGSKANVAMIQNLHLAGFSIKVCHYTRKEISLKNIDCLAIIEQKFTFWYLLAKLQLLLKRFTGWNINNGIESNLGFSFAFLNDSYSIQKALQKENPDDYDWVLTLSKGASFRPHHAVLKAIDWHDKWLAYVHDPYPFHCYPEPYDWLMPGYKQKEHFFKGVVQKAKALVFPSLLLQQWMEGFYPEMKAKGVVIPHQMDDRSYPITEPPDYFLKKGFTLLHAGNLMKQRSPVALVEGFQLFLEKNREAAGESQLLLVGPATYYQGFLDMAQQRLPQLYVSKGYVPYEEVRLLQSRAAVNIIMESDAAASPFLPGKFPHCVQANAPILLLSPKMSESFRLLGDNYPYQTENKNIDDIAFIIAKLYKKWKTHPSDFKLNRTDLEYYFSTTYLENQMKKLSST